ncbi:MAG: AMP-binding protein [Pirellulales bacterium]|nr:AMP-binding protein [Planctomycetales bacterium]
MTPDARHRNLLVSFVRNCKSQLRQSKVADTTGVELSAGKLLTAVLIFRRLLLREVLGPEEKFVGLLLPPSAGAAIGNAALSIAGRVPVNLNYTCSSSIINSCIEQCQIRHVLTSRRVMDKLDLQLDAELVFLEDLRKTVKLADKLASLLDAYVVPAAALERRLGLDRIKGDDLLTVLFTSGSTGDPKGVMLTHDNVASNIEAMNSLVHLGRDDVLCGVLPFFHSYGLTGTLWTMLALYPKAVYHFSPLDAKIIGDLCRKHKATLLMGTPTFLRNYIRRCQPEDFATMDVVFASAERLPPDVAEAFEKKFGVRPFEAYGATEMSPLVSVNVPPHRNVMPDRYGAREGSVGQPVPGTTAKVVHPDTGAPLPNGEAGLLLLTGPNVMKGYFNRPEMTDEVMRDGWYVTGDIAYLDDEGYIHITGRQTRFSKIAGEMVPHIKIEESINELLGAGEEEILAVVTAVPDEGRGERLIVLHRALTTPPKEICERLLGSGLPNLWIPDADSFIEVEEIPVLGTGKLDLRAMREVALQRTGLAPLEVEQQRLGATRASGLDSP